MLGILGSFYISYLSVPYVNQGIFDCSTNPWPYMFKYILFHDLDSIHLYLHFLTLYVCYGYTAAFLLNRSVFQSRKPSSVSRISRTSTGGFNPIFSARRYLSSRDIPTQGPYRGVKSKFRRIVCMVDWLSGWTNVNCRQLEDLPNGACRSASIAFAADTSFRSFGTRCLLLSGVSGTKEDVVEDWMDLGFVSRGVVPLTGFVVLTLDRKVSEIFDWDGVRDVVGGIVCVYVKFKERKTWSEVCHCVRVTVQLQGRLCFNV